MAKNHVFTSARDEARRSFVFARDAFNGALLWSVPCEGGEYMPYRHAFVATEDAPYTWLGLGQHMVALDARTGEMRLNFAEGIRVVDEMAGRKQEELWKRKTQFHAVVRVGQGVVVQSYKDTLMVLDARTGARRWMRRKEGVWIGWPVLGDGVVCFAESAARPVGRRGAMGTQLDRIVACDLASGKEIWSTDRFAGRTAMRLLIHNGRLLVASHMLPEGPGKQVDKPLYQMVVLDARTGRQVLQGERDGVAHAHYEVPFVTGGRMIVAGGGCSAWDWATGKYIGYFDNSPYDGCAEARASGRFIFYTMSFTELLGPGERAGHAEVRKHPRGMGRSSCDVGCFPAYGMLAITPSMCGCNDYLNGFVAFARREDRPLSDSERLRSVRQAPFRAPRDWPAADEWPVFLGDARRGSGTEGEGPRRPVVVWERQLARLPSGPIAADWAEDQRAWGPLTSPAASGGRVYVAAAHDGRLWCLDGATGNVRWIIHSAARHEVPPTHLRRRMLYRGT